MNKNIEDIKHIRSMMERSTKFLSVSGLAGVGAGITALAGAYAAHLLARGQISLLGDTTIDLFIVAATVVAVAATCGLYFSMRKARKSKSKFWLPITIQILKDFSVPMITGGILCLIMLAQGYVAFIAATMLIFYGLALIAAGARTYRDIKILGACEIVLGLLAAIFIHQRLGLVFWSLGFGVLHIVYGVVMYWKYDRENDKKSVA